MKNNVGKHILISKLGINHPEEVTILGVSDNGKLVKVKYPNGFENWINNDDYRVIDTLNKMDLHEQLKIDKNNPLNKKVTMIYD